MPEGALYGEGGAGKQRKNQNTHPTAWGPKRKKKRDFRHVGENQEKTAQPASSIQEVDFFAL